MTCGARRLLVSSLISVACSGQPTAAPSPGPARATILPDARLVDAELPVFVRPPVLVDSAEEVRAAAEAEADRIATTKRLVDSVVQASACIPSTIAPEPTEVDADETLGLRLGLVDGSPVACAVRRATIGPPPRPLGCWRVELATGAVVARRAEPLPGRSYAVALAHGCIDGLCGRNLDEVDEDEDRDTGGTDYLVIGADGGNAVFWRGPVDGNSLLFERATRKVRATISSPVPDGDWISDLALVGDTIVRTTTNAGNEVTVFAWRLDGKATKIDADLEEGGLQVLDARHLGFVSGSGTTLTTYDVKTHRRSIQRREIPPCTAEDFSYLAPGRTDNEGAEAPCLVVWSRLGAPFEHADWIRLPSGDYAVALTTSDVMTDDIAILDRELREVRRLKLARCTP